MPLKNIFIIFSILYFRQIFANTDTQWNTPDWTENAVLQNIENRANIYELEPEDFNIANRRGRLHTLFYTLPVTGLKVPYRPIEVITTPGDNPFKRLILTLAELTMNLSSTDDLYRLMGMKQYPLIENEELPTYFVPFLNNKRPQERMGITIVDSSSGAYVTASCTACHAETLFGRSVIGLTNKTPNANNAFLIASKLVPNISPTMIKQITGATSSEVDMWKTMQETFHSIGVKEPKALGLDTSVATVALSLAKRSLDPHATIDQNAYKHPRNSALETMTADSKPLPWFTLKYKNRWLSDGSVVSGNPILTNFLWNEIGRGVNLKDLSQWTETEEAKKMIIELTAAVFATTPPRYTDFFPATAIDLNRAKRGQKLFNESCFKCHGTYEKAWDREDAIHLTYEELLETTKVNYPKQTVVKDVGTDPNRYLAMNHLAPDLNRLAISQKMGIKVIPQIGYVPPPLVGIWSRWPYFHNNSAPTLCDVLSNPKERRSQWYVGSPLNKYTDFDDECNGFPSLENAPKEWRRKSNFFNTKISGLTNSGHSKTTYTSEEKKDLIAFLKTL